MAKIKLTAPNTLIDGQTLSFKAPCDCTAVDGLKVYFPNPSGTETSQAFTFYDAHGNDLTGTGNLFASGAAVTVVLDTVDSKAYIQNADTNAYIESMFNQFANPIKDYVRTEAEAVAENILSVTGEGLRSEVPFNMAFLSDLHYDETFGGLASAAQALQVIEETAPLDLVVFGGDYITNWQTLSKSSAVANISDCRKTFYNATRAPIAWLVGNHDSNGYVGERLTKAEVYNRTFRNQHNNSRMVENPADPYGCYGYMDFPNSKMRVIMVNTSDNAVMGDKAVDDPSYTSELINAHNVSAKQLQWIADYALDFSDKDAPTDWKFIICSHVPIYYGDNAWYDSHTYTDDNGDTWTCNLINLSNMMKAYVDKTSFSTTLNGETCTTDFASASDATFLCFVNGHGHSLKVTKRYGFSHIWIPNACGGGKQSDDGNTYTKTAGTPNDTAFNVLSFDPANEKVYVWKYGAGYDRIVKTIPFSNLIPKSTDSSGNIYNGVGYKTGTRLNSSGVESANNEYCCTGFIPCVHKSYLRLKNVTINNGTGPYIICYDENFNILQAYTPTEILTFTDGMYVGTISMHSSTRYIRLSINSINETSIATVNEEIIE